MRINITGNAASGKTTLAARLGARLDLPVISLDSIVWQPHWIKTPTDQRLSAEQRLVASPAWIIDGVSDLVRANADLVVFLDVPWPLPAPGFARTQPGNLTATGLNVTRFGLRPSSSTFGLCLDELCIVDAAQHAVETLPNGISIEPRDTSSSTLNARQYAAFVAESSADGV